MTTGVSVFLKVFGETEAVSIKIFQQFPKKTAETRFTSSVTIR